MAAAERRIAEWVEVVGGLLDRPTAPFPHREVAERLRDGFACRVSWSWLDPPGRVGFELVEPAAGWLDARVPAELAEALLHHPVLRFHRPAGDLRPMSPRRVPARVRTPRGPEVDQEHLHPAGTDQQLVIAYRTGPGSHRCFVLAHGQEDFPAEDLRVAVGIQPLLSLLDRYAGQRDGLLPGTAGCLTSRESAALVLLARGLTAAAIAHRLGISERTVHRHLQGLYGKLGVHDRLTAVLAARDAGMLAEVPTPGEDAP